MASKRRIDVMLSSTFTDLILHREAAIATINGLQLCPLAQEFDAALPDSDLIKASRDKVYAADAYIGLIGSRYGQRPLCPVRNFNQKSLTELEFDWAVDRQLPRCMFIMADDHALTLADLKRSWEEGSDGPRLRQAFIARVRADGVCCEFNSPSDLKAKITVSLVALMKTTDPGNGATLVSTDEYAILHWLRQMSLTGEFHEMSRQNLTREEFVRHLNTVLDQKRCA